MLARYQWDGNQLSNYGAVSCTLFFSGPQVKELSSCNPGDVLIGATLLMCAGRSREAIDYLVGSDRVKDALLLARIRLPSTELRDTIHLCVTRMSERRLVTDVPFVEAIYSVGEGALERAKSLCHRITVSGGTAGSRCSPAVELLSHAWTDVCLLSRETTTHQSKGLSIAYVHLVTPCLTQGFLLLPSANAASVYFQRWIDALSDSPTDCPGYFCILLLLDVAHAIVRTDPDGVQWSQFDSEIWFDAITGRGCDGDDGPNEILLVLNQLVSERQPSNDWVVSVVNSVVDTVACYVSAHDLQCTGESRRHYLSRVHDSLTELVAVMDRSSEDSSAIVGRMKALVESLPCQTAPLPCSVGGVPTTHS